MLKIQLFNSRMDTIVLRYYLMMLIVIIAGLSGQIWLSALAFPVFLSAILGVKFQFNSQVAKANKETMERRLPKIIKHAA